jgi:hypothetical protein
VGVVAPRPQGEAPPSQRVEMTTHSELTIRVLKYICIESAKGFACG